MAIAEGDAMLERKQMLIRQIPSVGWTTAHHIVALPCLWIITLVAQHLQHLETGRQRLGQCLSVGSLCQCRNAARHGSHVLVDLCTDDERLTSTARIDYVLLASRHEVEQELSRIDLYVFLPDGFFHFSDGQRG